MIFSLRLPRCADCARVIYPRQSFCPACLSGNVQDQEIATTAQLIGWTLGHVTQAERFRGRLPLAMGLLKLGCGPRVYAHLHPQLRDTGAAARLYWVRDPDQCDVLVAVPAQFEGRFDPFGL